MNLSRQAHDRAADLVLFALFYGDEYVARVASGQASHDEHNFATRMASNVPD